MEQTSHKTTTNTYERMLLNVWDEVRHHYNHLHKNNKHRHELANKLGYLWCELEPMIENTDMEDTFFQYERYAESPELLIIEGVHMQMYRTMRRALHTLGITKIERWN